MSSRTWPATASAPKSRRWPGIWSTRPGNGTGSAIDWRDCPLGADYYLRTGQVLPGRDTGRPAQDRRHLARRGRQPVGAARRPRARPAASPALRPRPLRQPAARPGSGQECEAAGADDLDFVVVRENTEGLYAGAGGIAHQGSTFEVATEESLNTRAGVERCVRYAARLARKRTGKLTLVHKTNVLVNAGSLWMRVAQEVAAQEGVQLDYAHVDAACLYMVSDPGRFDVIVTDNLFGDIITDLAAALTGGLGLSASGNLNPDRTGPSMFEPVHGSAPDIAGTGQANPAGAVLSAALMLDHLGEPAAAGRPRRRRRRGPGRGRRRIDRGLGSRALGRAEPYGGIAMTGSNAGRADGSSPAPGVANAAGAGAAAARPAPAVEMYDTTLARRVSAGGAGPDRGGQAAGRGGARRARRRRGRGRVAGVESEGQGVLRAGRRAAVAERAAGGVRGHAPAEPVGRRRS